ncbi:hypothetical protein HIM_07477 [Hirsutella minnesotensis 3608]|uniref:LicD/FKTN/FKRP nucleotidyltransferase domain-containing protein n=1 Tax=Hirsutella minnesotensis 3608 TaxID=1043627 RepID=A0A0F7ZTG9_9HYPO|nr:hypothetical protein HIM_07477 [Hirsutella minnesotensis 3608]
MPSLMTALLAGLAATPCLAGVAHQVASVQETSPVLQEQDGRTVVARDNVPHLQPKTPKYFHEPGSGMSRGHYDQRFFKQEIEYEEHRVVLRDLVHSYLAAMQNLGVETWLAHGTLLGWWWSGRVMPWDYDLDVQVTNDTMQWMGDHLNRTEHAFNATTPGGTVAKKYLLDVNPHHVDIDRGDGMNIIDARWIDMTNGMFIDITGLREREAHLPGVWSCKNKHRYPSQDLWPMRTTEFEGVRARIPYNFEKILSTEYGPKSLVTEEHAGHRWDRNIKEWVKMSPVEEQKRLTVARERKKQRLIRDGRYPS